MPKLREGYQQFNFCVQKEILEKFKVLAELRGHSVTAEIVTYMESAVLAAEAATEAQTSGPRRGLRTEADLAEEFIREQRLRRLERGLAQTQAAVDKLGQALLGQPLPGQASAPARTGGGEKRHLSESQPAGPAGPAGS